MDSVYLLTLWLRSLHEGSRLDVTFPERLGPMDHFCGPKSAKANAPAPPHTHTHTDIPEVISEIVQAFSLLIVPVSSLKKTGSMGRNEGSIKELKEAPGIRSTLESSVGKHLKKC